MTYRKRRSYLPFSLPAIEDDEIKEVVNCLKSGWITTGERVGIFEKEFAETVGSKYAVAVNSGTAALHLSLEAVGLRRGDKVLVPTFTFGATAEVVRYFDAEPVFVDVDRRSFLMSVDAMEERLERDREEFPKIRAVIPVHYAGQACDMKRITEVAGRYQIKVIEDAAHAMPASFGDSMVGSIGDLTAFSFYATKPVTTGEGGMVTTDNGEWAERISIKRLHGMNNDAWKRYSREDSWYYEIHSPGFKYNMTDIAASLGIHQLRKFERNYERRKRIAERYSNFFSALKDWILLPRTLWENTRFPHAWHLYVIRLNLENLAIDRDGFIREMKQRNIGTSVHFMPLHLQPYYRKTYGYSRGDFPEAEHIYDRCVSLPIYPGMSDEDTTDVMNAVEDIIQIFQK